MSVGKFWENLHIGRGREMPQVKQENTVPVSVVIPCFRCSTTIRRALTSVLQQSMLPVEIILVDDCSEDGTLPLLLQLQSNSTSLVKVLMLEKNGGAGAARNAGWAASTQPYIAFLDADDSWYPEKLALQYTFMEKHPAVFLSGHLCGQNSGRTPFVTDAIHISVSFIPTFNWLFKNAFSTPTVMLKRDIPFRFTPGRRYCEDFLLWQQIAFSGMKTARLELPLAQLHKPIYGAGGLSGQLWKMEQGELLNFQQLYLNGDIGRFMQIVATGFSLIKFAKRCIFTQIKKPRKSQKF